MDTESTPTATPPGPPSGGVGGGGPDHRDLYLIVVGVLLGVLLGPGVLGRFAPNVYDRIFVGRDSAQVISDEMERVVVNPYWGVPKSIIKYEMLPYLVNDPSYLEVREQLKSAMWREQARLGDAPHPSQPRPADVEDVAVVEVPEQDNQSFLELVGLHQPE